MIIYYYNENEMVSENVVLLVAYAYGRGRHSPVPHGILTA